MGQPASGLGLQDMSHSAIGVGTMQIDTETNIQHVAVREPQAQQPDLQGLLRPTKIYRDPAAIPMEKHTTEPRVTQSTPIVVRTNKRDKMKVKGF